MKPMDLRTIFSRSTPPSLPSTRIVGVLVLVVIAAGIGLVGPASAAAPDCATVTHAGNGTEATPYEVGTLAELQCVADDNSTSNASDHFRQTADIDASETASWNNGSGFDPIATIDDSDSTFSGAYDGNGYSISNLTINRPDFSYVGVFGYLFDGTLTDISLINANVAGDQYVGSLVAHGNGEIRNITVDASVTAQRDDAGGLAAQIYENTTVADVAASVSVLNPGGPTGGLIGYGNVTISRATVSGSITATSNAGGVVGNLMAGGLEQVNSSVAVNGGDTIGGVVGSASTTDTIDIRDTYARGSVDGSTDVGGFAGEVTAVTSPGQNGSITISNTYATGEVAGSSNVAGHTGLLGEAGSATLNVSTSYWDWERTTRASGVGTGFTEGFTALSTAELTGSAAATNLAGFDFDEVWRITPDSYPILRHERPVSDSLSITLENATLVRGETTNVTVTATDLQGQTAAVTEDAQLGSTDTSVVTVADDGTVTAVGEGQANVTAAHGGATAETPVTVTTDPIAAIPETYNGSITINGNPAPAGTVIEARIDDEVRGTVTVDTPGSYGSIDPFAAQLSVNGTESEAGTPVSFHLRPPESMNVIAGAANETSPFQPDTHTQLDLSASLEAPLPPVYEGTVTNDGDAHTVAFPGPTNATLGELFPNGTDGVRTIYSYAGNSWEQLYDPNQTMEALDALAIVTTGDGPSSIPVAIRLQNDTVASPVTLEPGWNHVAAPALSSAEAAFGGVNETLIVTDRYGTISTTEHSALSRFETYVLGSTAWGATAPDVSPFTGYFVYATSETTIPVQAQDFPHKQAADDLLGLTG